MTNSFIPSDINTTVLIASAIACGVWDKSEADPSCIDHHLNYSQLNLSQLSAFNKAYYDLISRKSSVDVQDIDAAVDFITRNRPDLKSFVLNNLQSSLNSISVNSDVHDRQFFSDAPKTPPKRIKYLIVGAGISGITFAKNLLDANELDFFIIDKQTDFGGTWASNNYPGVRVDVGNILYSFSFSKNYTWTSVYPEGGEIFEYIRNTAISLGLVPKTLFGALLEEARLTADVDYPWVVKTSLGTLCCHYLIMATGQLSVPNQPFKRTQSTFLGQTYHSTDLNSDTSIFVDKEVSLVGSASSAFQIANAIAPVCLRLNIIQRSPSWFHYVPHYRRKIANSQKDLYSSIPYYYDFFRIYHLLKSDQGVLPFCMVDQDGNLVDDSLHRKMISNINRLARSEFVQTFTPDYLPGAKRILVDDGSWINLSNCSNTTFYNSGVECLLSDGLQLVSGETVKSDIIIFATGFKSSSYGLPAKIFNKESIDLHSFWSGRPGAFEGISVPTFPNLFFLFGPNTNAPVQGATTFFSEIEASSILGLIIHAKNLNCGFVEVRNESYSNYLQSLDNSNSACTWGASNVSSWYKSPTGASSQNWPYPASSFWKQSHLQSKRGYADYLFYN